MTDLSYDLTPLAAYWTSPDLSFPAWPQKNLWRLPGTILQKASSSEASSVSHLHLTLTLVSHITPSIFVPA